MTICKAEQLPPSLRQDVERYMERHPGSPAVRLRPEMGMAQNVWIAFIEPRLRREGGIGVGKTPAEALERFDRNFDGSSSPKTD
jgi:hypothetical protein